MRWTLVAKDAAIVTKPSLAKSLLLAFSIIVLIEALLIGILCSDILQMESAAKKEFDAVSYTRSIYQVMEDFGNTLDAMGAARNELQNMELARKSESMQKDFLSSLKPQMAHLVSIGADPRSLERLGASAERSFQLFQAYGYCLDDGTKKNLKLSAVKELGNCYRLFIQQLKHVQELLKRSAVKPVFGLAPELLLQAGALVNITYLICLFSFVERSIRKPLSQLTSACEFIRARKPLPEFNLQRSELGVLQDSFKKMSEQVIENEKRRNNYVILLQSVQLSSIKTLSKNVEDLLYSFTLNEAAKSRLEKTVKSLLSLEALLHSMTQQLQGQSQAQPSLHPVNCSSNALLEEAAHSLESLLQTRRISLDISNQDHMFIADPLLISRVILNLVSNAIKYSPEGGEVSVRVNKLDNLLEFNVQDCGPGIQEQEQQKLFKRFSQLEALDGVQRAGSGLGLLICKELVEAHGGEIGCFSSPSKGSRFWFRLPIKANAADKKSTLVSMEKNNEDTLEKDSLRSIKEGFIKCLAIFVSAQAIIFMSLSGLLAESTECAGHYAKQKEELLATESCFLSFVQWGNRVQQSALIMDISGLGGSLRLLKKQRENLSKFRARIERESDLYKIISDIDLAENDLLMEMEEEARHPLEVLQDLKNVEDKMKLKIAKLEKSWKDAILSQIEGFQTSFDFSKQLRSKILLILFLAAVADLLLVSAAVFISLKLVGKILVLKSKTQSFAASSRIKPTLAGGDELSFLDQRLCQVANEILDDESKRRELLAVINHDLRTPLASILGTVENLHAGVFGKLEEEDSKRSELAMHDLETLLMQINDLLLLEKIESAAYVPGKEILSLDKIIEDSLQNISLTAKRKNLSIALETKHESEGINVKADRQLTTRTITIVLKNAVTAAEPGSKIELRKQKMDGGIIVAIKNTGQEVPPELLPQIFQRFRFVDGRVLPGFGLPLAFQACQLQRGSIRFVESEAGSTTVEINLPA